MIQRTMPHKQLQFLQQQQQLLLAMTVHPLLCTISGGTNIATAVPESVLYLAAFCCADSMSYSLGVDKDLATGGAGAAHDASEFCFA